MGCTSDFFLLSSFLKPKTKGLHLQPIVSFLVVGATLVLATAEISASALECPGLIFAKKSKS
jgi:hypothetical protein